MMSKTDIMQETRESLRVAEFNAKHPVHSDVLFRKVNGEVVPASIRQPAELRRGVGPVVWLDGIAGPKSLDRIEEAR